MSPSECSPPVSINVPGIPPPYKSSSIDSLRQYAQDLCDFLSSPEPTSLCAVHPNQIALPSLDSARTIQLPLGWWEFFHELVASEDFTGDLSPSRDDDALRVLIESARLPARKHHLLSQSSYTGLEAPSQ